MIFAFCCPDLLPNLSAPQNLGLELRASGPSLLPRSIAFISSSERAVLEARSGIFVLFYSTSFMATAQGRTKFVCESDFPYPDK